MSALKGEPGLAKKQTTAWILLYISSTPDKSKPPKLLRTSFMDGPQRSLGRRLYWAIERGPFINQIAGKEREFEVMMNESKWRLLIMLANFLLVEHIYFGPNFGSHSLSLSQRSGGLILSCVLLRLNFTRRWKIPLVSLRWWGHGKFGWAKIWERRISKKDSGGNTFLLAERESCAGLEDQKLVTIELSSIWSFGQSLRYKSIILLDPASGGLLDYLFCGFLASVFLSCSTFSASPFWNVSENRQPAFQWQLPQPQPQLFYLFLSLKGEAPRYHLIWQLKNAIMRLTEPCTNTDGWQHRQPQKLKEGGETRLWPCLQIYQFIVWFQFPVSAETVKCNSRQYTWISYQIQTKLRDWTVWQAGAGWYSRAAMFPNDSTTW